MRAYPCCCQPDYADDTVRLLSKTTIKTLFDKGLLQVFEILGISYDIYYVEHFMHNDLCKTLLVYGLKIEVVPQSECITCVLSCVYL